MITPREQAVLQVLERLHSHFFYELLGGIVAPLAENPDCWGYVAMDFTKALDQLTAARALVPPEVRRPRFLECGSGFGFISALAHGLGFVAEGIEICPRYSEVSRKLFPQVEIHDGSVLDFAGYERFDVVYYYGPFREESLSRQFELKVEAEAKMGAVILGNRKASSAWESSGKFRCLGGDGFMGVVLQKVAA